MRKISEEELNKILEEHAEWLSTRHTAKTRGNCANFSNLDLRHANFDCADLRDAWFFGSDLILANFSNAKLRGAKFKQANLRSAVLCGADMYGADLRGTNLAQADMYRACLINADISFANLSGAGLLRADMRGICYDEETTGFAMVCPEEGEFIGFKKAGGKIVKLLIPADAKRSSGTTRKCRCSKAKTLSITNPDGSESLKSEIRSDYSMSFLYRVGEYSEVACFDENRWQECASGIHFFITRDEAVRY